MNRFSYWWTKLRLRAAGCAVRWAKKQVLLDIQNSRRATMLLENPYQRFIRLSAKREELAVRLKRLSGQPDGRPPILGIRFDAGEITTPPSTRQSRAWTATKLARSFQESETSSRRTRAWRSASSSSAK